MGACAHCGLCSCHSMNVGLMLRLGGATFLIISCEPWESNSGHQSCWKTPVPTELSSSPPKAELYNCMVHYGIRMSNVEKLQEDKLIANNAMKGCPASLEKCN